MDEARRLLARLERIEALDRAHAGPGDLLAELRVLLSEAEAWARAEHPVPDEAVAAVDRCRELLRGPETAHVPPETAEQISGRTLLA
jgi:hypothetical protein